MLARAMHRFARPSLLSLAAIVALLVALTGCGGSKKSPSTTAAAATTTATTTTESAKGCEKVAMPSPKSAHFGKPSLKLDPAKTWTATVATNCGSFTIKLDVAHAPKTSASFAFLAKKHFYDKLTFHRIAPGFVIQGGDPLGNGTGGPGYSVVEAPKGTAQYTHGIVAMAKTGTEPNGASGSQFFVVTAPDAQLPPQYAILGKVTQGLDVVDRIAAVPLQTEDPQGSPPVDPIVMQSVTVQGS
jgi:cyclophilin family peptidyl-prolyl cis-trans isomerase/predicted small lipoprotein YifL